MADASSLRSILASVDGSAPAIQNAAGAMMKFYDRGATVAVNEWRNALQTCVDHQLLPLLYVANEVLQNSKRNRGNKFLEAMSPVLSQALEHICSRDSALIEKVRRTVKIWGDRQVFSTRFVGGILQGLEPYRSGRLPSQPAMQSLPSLSPSGASFSPGLSTSPDPTATTAEALSSARSRNTTDNDDDDDIRNIMDDNDDDDIFASNGGSQKLDVAINLGSALDEMASQPATHTSSSQMKRRRSSLGSQGSSNHPGSRKRRAAILSASNLMELWTRLTDLQQQYEGAQLVLSKIDERLQHTPAEQLENLVGDELQQAFQQNRMDEKQMTLQRQKLHAIAQERHVLEQEAKRYLPWLEKSLKQDEDDMVFCEMLEQKILSFQGIHAVTRKARDERVAEEQRIQAQQMAMERKRREEEEQEKFRQAALAKETEAKPNMVWNPSTREYQYLNTDESWRE